MAFVLIDGVIANDTFSAPATPTEQPIDGILGLAWTATSGGATNYSLTCASGSYAVTGKVATFALAKKLTAATGSYAVSGQSATFVLARNLPCSAGSYGITGTAATLTHGSGGTAYSLACASGAYSLTGNTANLIYTAISPVAYALSAGTGAYGLIGKDIELDFSGTTSFSYSSKINRPVASIDYSEDDEESIILFVLSNLITNGSLQWER